ncbi:MAG: MFS transporter, partial [bacterium]
RLQWQGLWWILAAASLAWAMVFLISFCSVSLPVNGSNRSWKDIQQICKGNPLLVSCVFVCYSAMFAAVTAFLPTYWIEQHHLDLSSAASMASIAVTGNIVGNIVAGILIQRGSTLRRMLMIAMLAGGFCAALIFSGWLTLSLEFVAAIGFTLFSGMLPGAVFASLGDVVPEPGNIPLFVGMIFQGAGIGQVLGPLVLSAAVNFSGEWIYASAMIVLIATTSLLLGQKYR